MKIMGPSVTLTPVPSDPVEAMKHVEHVGRLCYKSEDKITDDSYKTFIRRLIERGHTAMLEHSNVIYIFRSDEYKATEKNVKGLSSVGVTTFLRFTQFAISGGGVVSGNFRAWRDYIRSCLDTGLSIGRFAYTDLCMYYPDVFFDLADRIKDDYLRHINFPYSIYSDENSYKRVKQTDLTFGICNHAVYTAKFICDTGVSHELVRHRVFSFAQESTRYCNYSKGKFGKEISVIEPSFLIKGSHSYAAWKVGCLQAEHAYFDMLDHACTPQQARDVLPKSLKTELCMTGTVNQWFGFFRLRCAPDAHPQMQELARPLARLFAEDKALPDVTREDMERYTQEYISGKGWPE